ncbi:DUF1131 family protein [Rhodobium gokarnense]|uniref:RpoE-regulated lipoprotein n=1 Tax=Rhodobium gokarnense TaxID=364296 RepID=A0ABT3HC25_9HYPH|nr:DUF1131 family protein [Rhodobium gokarnense]MCW2307952.1 hypothetical protein [Rhodobium gokarnense]
MVRVRGRFILSLSFALGLAACSGATPPEGIGPIGGDVPDNAFSETNPYTGAGYDTPLPTPIMQFTATTAGPLGTDPAYSSRELQAKLPGFETATAETARENGVANTLVALHDGQQVLQLFKGSGGKVSEIHAASGVVAGPAGEQVGMTFRQAGMSRSSCRVGRNLWRGMAVCPSKGAKNVTLVFALPGYRGPFDRMPPEGKIGDAVLQRFVWTPTS